MEKDLFGFHREEELQKNAPLADRLRPTNFDEFVGQHSILAEGRLLRRAIEAHIMMLKMIVKILSRLIIRYYV